MPFVRYSEMDVFIFGPDGEKNWGGQIVREEVSKTLIKQNIIL